ncbi:hypothetical protein, partial [Kitasatospora sp. MY 5-36]|uniref:hypothetical protein n=1 Tax=Kitasatospora sp. MY 5-36 TaxID=1678027 RepID=UPI001F327CC7
MREVTSRQLPASSVTSGSSARVGGCDVDVDAVLAQVPYGDAQFVLFDAVVRHDCQGPAVLGHFSSWSAGCLG